MPPKNRERALKELNTFAAEIKEYDGRRAVCERTVEAAETILDFDICVINLERDGLLHIEAISTATPPDGATPMPVDEGMAGKTYRTGESYLVDDIEDCPDAKPQGPYRSALSVAVGGHGIFQTVADEPGYFDESDLELAELLVAHCVSALDRIEHTEEIRERTKRLQRQNERLDRFASVVSHDLRNPISVLEGYLQLAEETGDPEHFEQCRQAIDRMQTMIDDLLTLARQGATVEGLEPVSLKSVTNACWGNVQTDGATLEIVDTCQFRADSDRVRQVFENLFRNGVEHGGDGVKITVGVLEDGFYVEDDGPGIPEESRKEVFEPGISTREEGTGFGLSIVRTIAEAHDWSVSITESGDGGARFEFTGVEPA